MLVPDTFLGGILVLWFLLTAGSLLFLLYDLFTNTPSMWVMKLAWILIVLYAGPIGLFVYMLSCRQPIDGTHDEFIAPHWKQAVGSLIHCVAGDATGIILAAVVTYHLALPNGIDLIIEYATAYVFGLFIFQALFMKSSMGGSYLGAVKNTIYSETVSMNMVMVGMIPVMAILRSKLPGGDDPNGLVFWGIASLAAIAGGITAYPINSWLVRSGLKHGMLTASSSTPTGGHDMHMMQHKPSPVVLTGVMIATFVCLALVIWLTSRVIVLSLG